MAVITMTGCQNCNGSGLMPDTCQECHGTGLGTRTRTNCNHCLGTGIRLTTCSRCGGRGMVQMVQQEFPAGGKNGEEQ